MEGAVYGLYKVNEKGADILIEKQTSNSEGYMTFMKAVLDINIILKKSTHLMDIQLMNIRQEHLQLNGYVIKMVKFLIN